MRFAVGFALSSVVLAIAGTAGVAGSWSVAAAAVLILIAAVTSAIALESRDVETVRGLAGAAGRDDGTMVAPFQRAA